MKDKRGEGERSQDRIKERQRKKVKEKRRGEQNPLGVGQMNIHCSYSCGSE
jgi:hypothetical protein